VADQPDFIRPSTASAPITSSSLVLDLADDPVALSAVGALTRETSARRAALDRARERERELTSQRAVLELELRRSVVLAAVANGATDAPPAGHIGSPSRIPTTFGRGAVPSSPARKALRDALKASVHLDGSAAPTTADLQRKLDSLEGAAEALHAICEENQSALLDVDDRLDDIRAVREEAQTNVAALIRGQGLMSPTPPRVGRVLSAIDAMTPHEARANCRALLARLAAASDREARISQRADAAERAVTNAEKRIAELRERLEAASGQDPRVPGLEREVQFLRRKAARLEDALRSQTTRPSSSGLSGVTGPSHGLARPMTSSRPPSSSGQRVVVPVKDVRPLSLAEVEQRRRQSRSLLASGDHPEPKTPVITVSLTPGRQN
jgi:hypothetical protein